MGRSRIPEYALMEYEVAHGDFYRLEDASGNIGWYPCSEFSLSEVQAMAPVNSEDVTVETGWFACLDGDYVWEGPFDSIEETEAYMEDIA